MAKMSKTKASRMVHRLWNGGEKLNAIRLAEEHKLSPAQCPNGMKAHREGLRPELRK